MYGIRELGFAVPVRTKDEAKKYLSEQGVMPLLEEVAGANNQYPPDLRDLARLHWLVVSRKAFTVLEFGVGWSTLVVACALHANKRYWDGLTETPTIRNATPFSLFSVDASEQWIENARRLVPEDLSGYVTLCYSKVSIGTFNGRPCHFYEELPDIVPDFVYLDGPHPSDVQGNIRGLSWANPDRTVLSGDLLAIESTLLPGAGVLVDGRTNNVYFLMRNLQRRWGIMRHVEQDVTVMELQEFPLGTLNERTLRYSLGDVYFDRL